MIVRNIRRNRLLAIGCCFYHIIVFGCSQFPCLYLLFPTLGVGLLDFKLNSAPRPELFSSPGLLLAHPWSAQPQVSLECPTLECPWNAQPQSLPGVPNPECPGVPSPRVPNPESPECPAQESPWSAPTPECHQPQSLAECPRSAQPQSVYQEMVGMFEVK